MERRALRAAATNALKYWSPSMRKAARVAGSTRQQMRPGTNNPVSAGDCAAALIAGAVVEERVTRACMRRGWNQALRQVQANAYTASEVPRTPACTRSLISTAVSIKYGGVTAREALPAQLYSEAR